MTSSLPLTNKQEGGKIRDQKQILLGHYNNKFVHISHVIINTNEKARQKSSNQSGGRKTFTSDHRQWEESEEERLIGQ